MDLGTRTTCECVEICASDEATGSRGRAHIKHHVECLSFPRHHVHPPLSLSGRHAAGRHGRRTHNPNKYRSSHDAAGTGCSTESGLEQALDRASVSFDSDEELEAIRGSVRSLRAQRAAVEKLKEKARQEEGTAEVLRRKLGEAENRIRELRAQGGRDVVRRLMNEVWQVVRTFGAMCCCWLQTRGCVISCHGECCIACRQCFWGIDDMLDGVAHEIAAGFRRIVQRA